MTKISGESLAFEPDGAAGPPIGLELALLGILALLWGSSYLFIKIAVAEIPPITLIAFRVSIAAVFLCTVMAYQGGKLPTDAKTWRMLVPASPC